MKKVLIVILFFFIFTLNVNAYSNKYFNISIPDDYKISMENVGTYQWVNAEEGSNIVVSVALRPVEKGIKDYTTKEKAAFIDNIISELEAQYYKAYETKVEVDFVTSDEIKLNGCYGLFIKVKIDDFLGTGSEMNQYINVFESKNFLYSLVYSTAEKTYNQKAYNSLKNSFEIKDETSNTNFEKGLQTILNITSLAILISSGIYVFRRMRSGKSK